MKYHVNTIYPCIQGEGVLTGTPMHLIRMQGCSVGCTWCDTKNSWDHSGGHVLTTGEILDVIANKIPYSLDWVLITGGEPVEQPLAELVIALQCRSYKIALETSGIEKIDSELGLDWICLSPKRHRFDDVNPSNLAIADEIKMVIDNPEDVEDFYDFLNANRKHIRNKPVISIQPASQGKTSTQICINAAFTYGWRLSVQVHKYLNIP